MYTYDDVGNLDSASELTDERIVRIEDIRNAWDNEHPMYLAPSQSALAKWLREVHKIDTSVEPFTDEDTGKVEYVGWFYTDIEVDETPIYFATYEEAYESTLFEVLQYLEFQAENQLNNT
jgi:hypothetical protein